MVTFIHDAANYLIVLCGYFGIRSHVKNEAKKLRQHVTKALADHRKLTINSQYGKGGDTNV